MNRFSHILCTLMFSIGSFWGFAQQKAPFSHLGAVDGLSSEWVTGVVQDSTGFIYITTNGGFHRYDGVEFKVFDSDNSTFALNKTDNLIIDKKGRIWFSGYNDRIVRYESNTESFLVYDANSKSVGNTKPKIVNVLYEDRQGNIWAGTENGLSLYDEKTDAFQDFFGLSDDLSDIPAVHSLFERKDGSFWAGTANGKLYNIDRTTKAFSAYTFDVGGENQKEITTSIRDIEEWSDGLYLVTFGDGLVKLNLEKSTYNRFYKGQVINCLYRDRSNNLWIGANKSGLLKVVGDDLENSNYEPSDLNKNGPVGSSMEDITAIFEDRQGNIWLCREGEGGIDIIENKVTTIRLLDEIFGVELSAVSSIHSEKEILWVGKTNGGLCQYNLKTKTITEYGLFTKIKGPIIRIESIAPATNGDLWLGTLSNLVLFSPSEGIKKRFKRIPGVENVLPFSDINDISIWQSQDVWIASKGGGLSHYDEIKGTFTNYRHQDGKTDAISSDRVISLFQENDSILWVGTHGGGLNRLNIKTKKFQWFFSDSHDDLAIGNNYIFDILKDHKKNVLWLAKTNGLGKLDLATNEIQTIKISDNSQNHIALGLLQDDQSRIWATTNKGLFVYDPNKPSVTPVLYGKGEFFRHSSKDSSGMLYFTGRQGVAVVDSKADLREHIWPEIVFTDLQFFNESVPIMEDGVLDRGLWFKEKIELPYNKRVFSLNFSSLQYPSDKDVVYDIKMDGFEENWRNIGTRNQATYTNMAPGEYVFKIRPKINKETVHGPIKTLKVVILPPFWRTWWAYLAYGIILLAVLWSYRYYTLKWAKIQNDLRTEMALREQEDELYRAKERFFTDISHEIRTPVTLITGALNSLSRESFGAPSQRKMGMLKGSANRLLNLVNELLNFRKLEAGTFGLQVSENDLNAFVHEIFLAFTQQGINNEIHYSFEKSGDHLAVWFDKVQLEKTLYNLISNAFKFTGRGDKIAVRVYNDDGQARIEVADSGIGIPVNDQSRIFERFYRKEDNTRSVAGFGIGLSVAKQVVKQHGGNLSVESEPGQGSCFTVRLPMGRSHFTDAQIVANAGKTELSPLPLQDTDGKKPSYLQFSDSNVLVVEDDHHLRDYLCELLSEHFQVESAPNGKIALEMATESVPDCIVSDVMMPEMNGIALCHALKTGMMTSHIPVILLTARTMVEHIMEGYETGADDYLLKPFNEEILKVRIGNLLANRERLRKRFAKQSLIDPREIALTSPDEKFLSALNEVVERNISKSELNTDLLVSEMAMSHSGLYKKLKALTGMTIVGFVRDFRLKRAAQMLAQHQFSVSDVCYDVGYNDRRHFSREFKKKFGITPSKYVKRHHEKESQPNPS